MVQFLVFAVLACVSYSTMEYLKLPWRQLGMQPALAIVGTIVFICVLTDKGFERRFGRAWVRMTKAVAVLMMVAPL